MKFQQYIVHFDQFYEILWYILLVVERWWRGRSSGDTDLIYQMFIRRVIRSQSDAAACPRESSPNNEENPKTQLQLLGFIH